MPKLFLVVLLWVFSFAASAVIVLPFIDVESESGNPLIDAIPKTGWYDPSDTSTTWQDLGRTIPAVAEGDEVLYLDDKSGNGYDLQVDNASPSITVNRINGRTALDFNPAGPESLSNPITGLTYTQITVAFVLEMGFIFANNRVLAFGGNNSPTDDDWRGDDGLAIQVRNSNDAFAVMHDNDWDLDGGTSVANTTFFGVVEFDFANNTQQMWVDGVLVDSETFVSFPSITPNMVRLGSSTTGGNAVAPGLDAKIGEIMFMSGLEYSANKAVMDAYFTGKWGIP